MRTTLLLVALTGCAVDGFGSEGPDGGLDEDQLAVALSGRIQAEAFRAGGEGVGYHDSTAGNSGGAGPDTDVDVQVCTDAGGGQHVGWVTAGEWLAFDVTAAQAGRYTFTARVASGSGGSKSLHLEVDGQALGSASFTDSSGWQAWRDLPAGAVDLAAGNHLVKVVFETGKLNLNYIGVAYQPLACTPSSHYGVSGELWSPQGRLIDHGYAGYRSGEAPIPGSVSPLRSVTDFGAQANDGVDDTQAFIDAIAGTASGTLTIPEGRFILTRKIDIKKSNLVLRGAGAGRTTLYFPKSLGDVYGIVWSPAGYSSWAFEGAFLTVKGADAGKTLASVTAPAARGARSIKVSTTAGIAVGQMVRIVQKDAGGTLLRALHAGLYPGDTAEDTGRELFRFYSRVSSIAGNTVTLERPLPLEIDTAWTPQVRAAAPSVRGVGIENLTIEFAGSTYPGHFKERGYNAIQLEGAFDSWVRNVTILNADYGLNIRGSHFCTISDVVLDTNVNRGNYVGHHGMNSVYGTDVLFTRFDVRKKFHHDLTVDNYAFGTVFSDGKGVDLNMDHHGHGPYGSLFTRLDLGAGTRPWDSGGKGATRMPHSAARSAYWNITANRDIPLPPSDYGPVLTFVGVRGSAAGGGVPADWSVERIPSADLCQVDLYQAMRQARGLP